ncbi:hypothetical protein C5167_044736 [Papaver somniferum]|nr:hypothetical protein C5167_044736 [Papaver somniferum]
MFLVEGRSYGNSWCRWRGKVYSNDSMLDSGKWIFFRMEYCAYGVADAHVQGGMMGDLSLMFPEFMQSFLAGLSFSGALTSALRLITKLAF